MNEIRREELKQLEEAINLGIEKEAKARIDTEKQLMNLIDERFNFL